MIRSNRRADRANLLILAYVSCWSRRSSPSNSSLQFSSASRICRRKRWIASWFSPIAVVSGFGSPKSSRAWPWSSR